MRSFARPMPRPVVIPRGLVLYLTFDHRHQGKLIDYSPYHNHGIINGATWARGRGGRGWALSFDGVDDYLDCGNNTSVLVDAFTIVAWMKTTSTTRNALCGWADFGTTRYPGIIFDYTTTGHLLYLGSDNYRYFSTTPDIRDGAWHQVAFVVTGNGQYDINNAKMYADGQEVNVASTSTSSLPAAKTHFFVGYSYDYFAGSMAEIRLYNRALSAEEIRRIHYAGL